MHIDIGILIDLGILGEGMAKQPDNSVHPKSRSEWRTWLEQNHTRKEGIWLITYKKATGKPRVEYKEAVEEALC